MTLIYGEGAISLWHFNPNHEFLTSRMEKTILRCWENSISQSILKKKSFLIRYIRVEFIHNQVDDLFDIKN